MRGKRETTQVDEVKTMSNKYPNCQCETKRYSYFRRRYRNGTLHMFRKCASCDAVAQNAMTQQDYEKNWVDTLPVMKNGVMEQSVQPKAEPVRSTRKPSVRSPKSRAQSRAAAIMEKLQNHINTRKHPGGNHEKRRTGNARISQ